MKKAAPALKVNELFSFNLLPPKTAAEVAADVKRFDTNFYAMLAPGLMLIILVILLVLNHLVLIPSKTRWEESIANIVAQLSDRNSALGQAKLVNGELKLKTDAIVDAVGLNVDFSQIFTIIDSVFAGLDGTVPISYAREANGKFVVNAAANSEAAAVLVFKRFQEQKQVIPGSVELRRVELGTNTEVYSFTIAFEIALTVSDGTTTNGQ